MGHFFLKYWYLYESTFKFLGGKSLPKPNQIWVPHIYSFHRYTIRSLNLQIFKKNKTKQNKTKKNKQKQKTKTKTNKQAKQFENQQRVKNYFCKVCNIFLAIGYNTFTVCNEKSLVFKLSGIIIWWSWIWVIHARGCMNEIDTLLIPG